MEYRALGKTGLQVSKLGFGASPFGSAVDEHSEREAIQAVHMAIDLGVNFIDVSPYYGVTRAETVLGKALQNIPRESYYLSTKVGRYGAAAFDFSEQCVAVSIDESLKRLHVDYVDVILCHDVEFGSLDQIINETIPALRRIQEAGKARFIGISGLPLKIFRAVTEQTDLDLILSYCHYCLNDTALAGLVPYFNQKQIGIINASPFSMGLLTESGPPVWHPASDELKTCCAAAARYCRNQGVVLPSLPCNIVWHNLTLQPHWWASPVQSRLLLMSAGCMSHLIQNCCARFSPFWNRYEINPGRAENQKITIQQGCNLK